MTQMIGAQIKPIKNTVKTMPWFSGFNRKLGKAISMALKAFEPSGSPYFYQLLYLVLSVNVS